MNVLLVYPCLLVTFQELLHVSIDVTTTKHDLQAVPSAMNLAIIFSCLSVDLLICSWLNWSMIFPWKARLGKDFAAKEQELRAPTPLLTNKKRLEPLGGQSSWTALEKMSLLSLTSFHNMFHHLRPVCLVGGWNDPSEKYAYVKLDHFLYFRAENKKSWKPPPSHC